MYRMNTLFSAELYKLKRMKIVWIAALVPLLTGASLALQKGYLQMPLLLGRPSLNYIGLLCYIPGVRSLAIVLILAAVYMASLDFEERTIQNILSKGVDRRFYYCSRLLAQFFYAALVFGGTMLLFLLCRLYRQQEQGVFGSLTPVGEFFAALLVSYLQLCAYGSISNMLSIFMKKQSTSMIAAFVWLVAELVSPILEVLFPRMGDVTWFVPLIVLENGASYIGRGMAVSFTYLRCGLSALVIIFLTSAVGYWKFCCTDQTMIEEEE